MAMHKEDDDFEETWDHNNLTLDKFKEIVKEGVIITGVIFLYFRSHKRIFRC